MTPRALLGIKFPNGNSEINSEQNVSEPGWAGGAKIGCEGTVRAGFVVAIVEGGEVRGAEVADGVRGSRKEKKEGDISRTWRVPARVAYIRYI